VVPAAEDLALDAPVLLDPHGPLERQAVGRGLPLLRAVPGRLARAVKLVEGGEQRAVGLVPRVQRLVEHTELVDVHHVQVVVPDDRARFLRLRGVVVVVVIEHDGRGPVGLKRPVLRGAGVVLERHDHHGGPLVILGHVHGVVAETLGVFSVGPVHVPVLFAPVVPVVRDIPEPDQILLIEDDRSLMVPAKKRHGVRIQQAEAGSKSNDLLVRHAPYPVHGIIIHTKLCLAPQGVAKIFSCQTHDDSKHVMLDVGPDDHDLNVLGQI